MTTTPATPAPSQPPLPPASPEAPGRHRATATPRRGRTGAVVVFAVSAALWFGVIVSSVAAVATATLWFLDQTQTVNDLANFSYFACMASLAALLVWESGQFVARRAMARARTT